MVKVGCLINLEALLVDFLRGSVTMIDLDGAAKKKR